MADKNRSYTDIFNFGYYPRFLQWRRTSDQELEEIDRRILGSLSCIKERKFVPVGDYGQLWSISCNPENDKTPIILVHGMGGGVGLWAMNLDTLSKTRPVYACDLLGFGRSSRPIFHQTAQEAEEMFVESIENYRKAMGADKFILLGHSLGGFLSASYSLRYPEHVKHLILVDPWGMSKRPVESRKPMSFYTRLLLMVVSMGYPLTLLRLLGPFGPGLVKRYRPHLGKTFGEKLGDNSLIHDYIYHCNAQDPSGEVGFKSMMTEMGWAKEPMIERLRESLDPSMPVTFVYGADSWVDRAAGLSFKASQRGYVDVQILRGAGHHVYADRWDVFNTLVEAIACSADEDRLPSLDEKLLQRIHGIPSSGDLCSLSPEDPDFQHLVGHGDENASGTTTAEEEQQCDDPL